MSCQDRLEADILAEIDRLQRHEMPLQADWIANSVCQSHAVALPEAGGEDSEFWRFTGYRYTREVVRRCISKRLGLVEPEPKQGLLPGFEHLQAYYMVERNGRQVGVHVSALTDAEIEEKALSYEAMGAACFKHAKALRDFRSQRAAPATQGVA